MFCSSINSFELFPFQVLSTEKNERFMGSTLLLTTKDNKYIYKILKNDNCNELDFYSSINKQHLLKRHDIIPKFIRFVLIIEVGKKSKKIYLRKSFINSILNKKMHNLQHFKIESAIEMKNFLSGYSNINIIDLKLGTSWIGESKNDSIYNLREVFTKTFPDEDLVQEFNDIFCKIERIPEKTEFMNGMLYKLKSLRKSIKQYMIINNSCQYEIGIRIQGLISDKITISRQRGKELTSNETMKLLSEFLKLSPNLIRLTRKKVELLKFWLERQKSYRFIATSIVLAFDRLNVEKCDIRWLDFTHALKQNRKNEEDFLMNEGLIKGLDSILKSIENIEIKTSY
ncbi:hypothetical protein CPHLJ_7g2990 [Cryptosporidium parvum]|nr:Inositol polyphosphate kinase [Cryptosporidium parvum]WKS78986.1 hypothetical protein CPCDC_7g2990 [Cryptosporidium sp. 43IA8]WRK33472.1 Inositol polyphosphate kinase [Cryptosporidium parvum]|eukprot:QOY40617.1 hypothetical protein CPATCC_003496 [Cryptosporidium parvum]